MGDQTLAVEIRNDTGKGLARRLRRDGRVPAVLYGHGKATVSLAIEANALEHLLKTSHAGLNTLIDLAGASEVKGRVVLVKELQRHPVAGTLVHADFFEIDTKELLHIAVPIRLLGSAAGVNFGGILEHIMREIELACLPTAIPDSIEIDISHLEVGDSVHVSDLTLPEGVETALDPGLPVAHVAVPKIEEEPIVEELAEGEAAEAAEAGEGADGAEDGAEASGKGDDKKKDKD
ncbi:MAG: 50S ribosomal protein L25 [Deltaproteobacteria bacterium]|nr:50S ribosomal protein L25 [Deltaproteobacteria bacterium]